MSEPEHPPVLRVLNADATDEEVAALVAALSALGPTGAASAPRPRPSWSDPARVVRRTHRSGPGGWRASGLPG
ncbi:acyl-CoA carboxylase epsilon subunit [Nocardioides sp. SYSU D00065]|uniref:acyl-CoA carboxylase epsilon subunit n=1 Tax=Nocardioides sp. SYSU D00065 TaxID=2817378 RepID=UPI001B333DE2|nr:acyl-CoA carboxylase epsilon subunit [Nocardioides sp. SYSU D00065]